MSIRSTNHRTSRYVQGGTTTQFPDRLGWWERRKFTKSATDVPVVIEAKYALRPDLMAYDLYGRASYDWVILQFNSIVDINAEFVEGAVITVPLPSRVHQEFLNKSPSNVI